MTDPTTTTTFPDATFDSDGPDRGAASFNPVMWFPPAEKQFVQTCYRMADSILEYGSGGSTVFLIFACSRLQYSTSKRSSRLTGS